jgi:hypothetical protein
MDRPCDSRPVGGQSRAAVKAAGIARDSDKKLTPSLRHSFGSNLLGLGEELVNVSRWLGHKRGVPGVPPAALGVPGHRSATGVQDR